MFVGITIFKGEVMKRIILSAIMLLGAQVAQAVTADDVLTLAVQVKQLKNQIGKIDKNLQKVYARTAPDLTGLESEAECEAKLKYVQTVLKDFNKSFKPFVDVLFGEKSAQAPAGEKPSEEEKGLLVVAGNFAGGDVSAKIESLSNTLGKTFDKLDEAANF